jgi:CheY-like chemotaxis protein
MSSLRILVIDDSLTIRKLVEIALRGSEHVIEYAASGQAGIDRAAELQPELVLCDYVLPDRRGDEVCRAIARDPRSQRAALVVMTGKQEQVRAHFADLTILDYLPKPFAPEAVVALVAKAATRRAPTFAATRETALALASSFRAALYEVLCERLARIPAWSGELGAETPATFFARKLFTESVLAELFEALLPIYQQTRTRVRDRNLVAEGSLAGLRPARLIELALGLVGTSELTFVADGGTTVFFITGGRLYLGTPGAAAAAATADPATLAEALRGHDGRFTWRRLELVPAAMCGAPIDARQLQLECLRQHDDLPVVAPHHLLLRCAGFSDRVRGLALSREEQRVVTLVDGAATAGDVVRRLEATPAVAQQAIARLVELGLLRHRRGDRGDDPGPQDDASGQLIAVVDADADHFSTPLARYLAEVAPTVGVIAIDGHKGVDAVLTPRPTSVIIDATAHRGLAQALAARPGGPRVIAVLSDDLGDDDALRAAGCAAVLAKPIHVHDLRLAVTGAAPTATRDPQP